MSYKIETISDEKCQLGEGPFWDKRSQTLYYVDIIAKAVVQYNPSTKSHARASVGDRYVSFIIPVQNQENTFLIGSGNEIVKIIWDGISDKIEKFETVCKVSNAEGEENRFNDGKADPLGRIWTGTMLLSSTEEFQLKEQGGTLYGLKADKTLTSLTSGIRGSNGMAWNEKINKFYYVDSFAKEIYEFDYNDLELTNKKVIFNYPDAGVEGFPDGMTIDTDGNLWVACFNSSKVIKIDPRKPNTLLFTIDMPVPQITSVEFGGPNYEELYVTSGSISWEGQDAPEGGWTYKVTGLGVKGLQAREIRL